MRYHLTPMRMATMKKKVNNKYWQRCKETGISVYCWWESKLVQLLWKIAWLFLKLNTELPSASNSTSRCIPQRNESRDSNRYLYTNAHRSIIHKSQKVETTQVSIKEQISKTWYVHTKEYYSALKRKEILTCAINMNEP